MKQILLVLALALAITGCPSNGDGTVNKQVEVGCSTAAAALKALTAAQVAGKLTPQQAQQAHEAASHVTPVCASPIAPTPDSLKMQAFLQGVAALSALAK